MKDRTVHTVIAQPAVLLSDDRARGIVHGARHLDQADLLTISDACVVTGLSRATIYRCLVAGKLRAKKSGSRTLILASSIREYMAGLPDATFTAPSASKDGRPARRSPASQAINGGQEAATT